MKATFAAGCFWHVQADFDKIKGVKTTVGYMGGDMKNPRYEDVHTGKTGHAEVVQIEYDPSKVAYKQLLKTFWELHDPTTKNRQGFDFGTQYRSVIFYHNESQKKEAMKSMEEEQKKLKRKIVTEIKEAMPFYKAEEYHQKYFEKTGQKTCPV